MRTSSFVSMALVAAIMAAAGPAFSDIIQLRDGQSLHGHMSREKDRVTIKVDDGTVVTTTPDQIAGVTLTSTVTPAQAADAEWTRAAAQIKASADIGSILSIHQKFLEQYPDQPISAGVRASLAEYEKLSHQKAVKFRGRWMPSAQVQVTLQQWAERAKPATDLYKAGNLRGALDAAKTVLNADANNPNALTIAGLASYRLNALRDARDYFAALAVANPSDVLAENNLAVVLFLQHREAESLLHYSKALQASPNNRFVADNIEEALAAYKPDPKNPAYQELLRQFTPTETRIESEMAGKGLYRFGSSWLTPPLLDRFNAQMQAIQNGMSQLDTQYQSARQASGQLDDKLRTLDAQITSNANDLNYINTLINSGNGDMRDLTSRHEVLAADYQRLQRERNDLLAQQSALTASAPDYFAQASKWKAVLAAARQSQFTGQQRILDLGESDNPPGPVVVNLPSSLPLPAPLLVQQTLPMDPYQNELSNDYRQFSTPIGLIPPIILIPPGHHPGHGGGDHGGDHGGGHGGDHGGDHGGGHGGDYGHSGGQVVPVAPVPPVPPRLNVAPPSINSVPPTVPDSNGNGSEGGRGNGRGNGRSAGA